MAKVYVITKGCYSDYHICAVTLDKKKAERLCKLFDGGGMDESEIEEWDTEKHDDFLAGRMPYRVIFLEDGNVFSVDCDTWGLEYFETGITETPIWQNMKKLSGLRVNLYAEDKVSAIKIAAEKRAKYLAEKEGIA